MVEIKKLPANRWKDCRNLRLEALKNDPAAFGSSYEEEIKIPESGWKKRMKNALFALNNNMPIGIITYVFESKKKTKHIANIYGVYVKKEYRGQGAGDKLIEWARASLKLI